MSQDRKLFFVFTFVLMVASCMRSKPTALFENISKYHEGGEHVRLLADPEAKMQVLEVRYPKDSFGTPGQGGAFASEEFAGLEKVRLTFYVKFSKDFDFLKGGKLHGLSGGLSGKQTISGGKVATGENGFSVRTVWRENGALKLYVYHMDSEENQKRKYGVPAWKWGEIIDTSVTFERETWYRIRLSVQLNDPRLCDATTYLDRAQLRVKNASDRYVKSEGRIDLEVTHHGILQTFHADGFCFRKTPDLKINSVLFDTFFGGADPSYAPQKDEFARFAGFKLD